MSDTSRAMLIKDSSGATAGNAIFSGNLAALDALLVAGKVKLEPELRDGRFVAVHVVPTRTAFTAEKEATVAAEFVPERDPATPSD